MRRLGLLFPLILITMIFVPGHAKAVCTSGETGSGNWSVNTTVVCSDMTIVLNGNLLINGSGDLSLYGVVLEINSSHNGEYGIENNGTLFLWYSKVKSNTTYAYTFVSNPGASLEINDSEIYDCGYAEGINDIKKGGLYIGSAGAKITNTTFSRNFMAIRLYSQNITITDNRIISNSVGLQGRSSGHVITGNTIRNNPVFGYGLEGENIRFENNVIENNSGIILVVNNSVINNNSFINNTVWGLVISGNNNNITNNTIRSNKISLPNIRGVGLGIADSENTRVTGNTVLENGIGINAQRTGYMLLKDNLFNRSEEYDIAMLSARNTAFENTNYTTLAKRWYLNITAVESDSDPVGGATVVIRNNFTTAVFSGSTDSQGRIAQQEPDERIENGSGTFSFNPYMVTVNKSGYRTNTTYFNLTDDKSLGIVLEAEQVTNETNVSLILTILSPQAKTYIGTDPAINNSLMEAKVQGNLTMSSCNYSLNTGTQVAMENLTGNTFRKFINVSSMEGTYTITFYCTSLTGKSNSTSLNFIIYPSYTCYYDNECTADETCVNGACRKLNCTCGYPSNHTCVSYECCDDNSCKNEEYCNLQRHKCESVPCTCGVVSNHKCTLPSPEYCCFDAQCGDDQVCNTTTHKCVTQNLTIVTQKNIVAGQNISVYVHDQENGPVDHVKLTVTYASGKIEEFYTNTEGRVNVSISEAGNVQISARKSGFATSSVSFDAAQPFDWLLVLMVAGGFAAAVAVVLMLKKFVKKNPVKMNKMVSGRLVMLKVKNRSRHTLRNISVEDLVPSGGFLRCNVMPDIQPVDNVTDRLIWDIIQLEPREEIVIEYEASRFYKGFSVRFGGKEYRIK